MPHFCAYNPELGIIETKYSGVVTFNEIVEFSSEVILKAKEHDCFLTLGDYSKAHVEITIFEIYKLPKIIAEKIAPFGIHPHKFKRAFVIAEHMKDFYFFETVTLNSGQNAKIFRTVDEARNWLLNK